MKRHCGLTRSLAIGRAWRACLRAVHLTCYGCYQNNGVPFE